MEADKLTKRNTRVDTMKALLIIAMVIGHSTSPWTTYIYLFHMPAFIMLSGYTYSGERYKTGQYIRKKLQTILIPTVLINIVYVIYYCLMQSIGLYAMICEDVPMSLGTRISGLFLYWATPDLGGATWFLIVLFETECIVKMVECFLEKIQRKNLFLIIILMLGCSGYILIQTGHFLPYCIDLALMACLYYGMGILIRKTALITCIDKKVMFPFCVITTFFFGRFYFYGTLPMNWPTRDFSNLFVQLLSYFAAIYLIWCIAVIVNASVICSVSRWIGRHTYCILITHFAVFRLFFWIGYELGIVREVQLRHLVPDAETASKGGWILISVLTISVCCLIAKLAEKNRWTNYLFNARI